MRLSSARSRARVPRAQVPHIRVPRAHALKSHTFEAHASESRALTRSSPARLRAPVPRAYALQSYALTRSSPMCLHAPVPRAYALEKLRGSNTYLEGHIAGHVAGHARVMRGSPLFYFALRTYPQLLISTQAITYQMTSICTHRT